ncbi:MAG: PAS domain S-box protein [Steroidobacteraceae bacterium]
MLFPRIRRKTFTREAFSWERPISPAGGRTPGLEKSLAIDEATKRLIDALMEPIVAVDSTGLIAAVNREASSLFGYELVDVVGQPVEILIPHAAREAHVRSRDGFFASPVVRRLAGRELFGLRKDGTTFPAEVGLGHIEEASGSCVLAIIRDLTDRRRLEHALVDSASLEQQKFGRDLHDGLGQELTGIAMLASAAASSLKQAGRPEAAQIKDIANNANLAIRSCRAIAHGLSPLTFARGSLAELLKEMTRLQRDSFGIDASCEVIEAASLRLGRDVMDNLYRISQEAVANARRHGQAKSIKVALNIQPTTVRLDVVDDGIGLPQAPASETGMGLKIMQFRAKLIGASLTILPGEHGGTRVTVECPQPL